VTRLSSAEWVDPQLIRFKISPHDDLQGTRSGNWDIDRRYSVETIKYRSIIQRYVEGRDWGETDLFRDNYAERIKREPIRGEATLEGLLEQYRSRVDGIFEDLKHKGFRTDGPLPRLLIGRSGEVFIGNQGNHRLAMAHVLGLTKFAGEVICRHRTQSRR
jgi:hypothetical protein